MAKCPNCKSEIAWDVPACPRCSALFDLNSAWRPVPDSDDEAENLANKYAARPESNDEPLSLGGGLWTVLKLSLSLVLVLLVLLIGFTYSRQPRIDWAVLGVLGVFIFLTAALWIDYTKPSKAVALFMVVVALGVGGVGRGHLLGTRKLPQACAGARRWLICELENRLFEMGGVAAVAAFWFLSAAFMLYIAYRLFISSREQPSS